MKKLLKIFLITSTMLSANYAVAAVKAPQDADKILILDYLQNVMAAKNSKIAGDYMAETVIQHGARAKDGLAGIKRYLNSRPGGGKPMDIEPYHILKQDDLIVVHTNLINSNHVHHYMHMFRVEDKKITEYWEAEQVIQPNETPYLGENEITDLGKTETNRLLVMDFVNDVYVDANPDKINDYVAADMLQHDKRKKAGAQGIATYITAQSKRKVGLEYVTIQEVVAEGNFVMVLSETKLSKLIFASYDIYRVQNDKIVEHWNVNEKVPKTMGHDNGAF